MATITLSLPDPLKDWVDVHIKTAGYIDSSDYLRDLIRRDRERSRTVATLQGLLDDGLESGISERSMSEVIAVARRQAGTA